MRPTRLYWRPLWGATDKPTEFPYVPESDLLEAIKDRDEARAAAARWATRVKLLEERARVAAESLEGKRDPDTEPRFPAFLGCKCGRCGG